MHMLLAAAIVFTAPVVCLDPGHPSENNSGAVLVNGIREVTICWEVSLSV